MADIYFPEDMKAFVYNWVEKEVSSDAPNGTRANFKVGNSIANVLGIHTVALPDYKDGDNWAIRDVAVFYRKNGVDTKVDEAAIQTAGVTTITFAAAVMTDTADSIVVSYPYAGAQTTFTCSVKDFSKSGGESDSDVTNTIGGCSYKGKKPASLVEIQLTAIKNGVRLSEAVNGTAIRTTTEVSGKTIVTTSQSNNRQPKLIVIKGGDPVNTSIQLIAIARNVDGVTQDHSGGAEDSWEESVTFKTNQQNYGEIEVR